MENKYVKNLINLGEKYNFKVITTGNKASLLAKNIDNKNVSWINYDIDNDKISYLGNTDNCNLWFHETRTDLTPEILVDFINDLNNVFELEDENKFTVRELIDPEDWQEIANISDASDDCRYKMQQIIVI